MCSYARCTWKVLQVSGINSFESSMVPGVMSCWNSLLLCLHSACLYGYMSGLYISKMLCSLMAHPIGQDNSVSVVVSFVAASPFLPHPPAPCSVDPHWEFVLQGINYVRGQLQTSNIRRLQYCNYSIRKDRVLYLGTPLLQCLLTRGQES